MLSIYNDLMEQGSSLCEIDTMDIFYYFDILAYRKRNQDKEERGYIDQIF